MYAIFWLVQMCLINKCWHTSNIFILSTKKDNCLVWAVLYVSTFQCQHPFSFFSPLEHWFWSFISMLEHGHLRVFPLIFDWELHMHPVGPKPTISPSICLIHTNGDAIWAKSLLAFVYKCALFKVCSILGARYFGTL